MNTIVPYSNEDTEKLYICPYDKTHTIRAFKFNQHLRKCRRNHGGQGFAICSYNQSHHVPAAEIDHHMRNCPDRHVIMQDVMAAKGMEQHVLPEINHHPEYNKPDSSEDWDAEFEEDQLRQNIENLELDHEEQVEEDVEDEESVPTVDTLLPERPPNWDQMTPSQKKNYRRKYNKQQEKMQSLGLTPESLQKSENPEDWTEEDRDAKLKAILSLYPPPNSKINSEFIDYKSVLNQYCQKNKINAPKYAEVSSGAMFGGFQIQVTVQGKEYRGREKSKTKKDAGHIAAKWALLAMKLPEEEQAFQRPRPIKSVQDVQSFRSAHELALLQSHGQLPTGRPGGSLNQLDRGPVNGVQNGGWNTVGNRRGRGRGTALAMF